MTADRSQFGADHPTDSARCPLCNTDVERAESVYATAPNAVCPTHCAVVCDSSDAARAWPNGSLDIIECPECRLVFNRSFDPQTQRFDRGYEESQAASGVFSAFERSLVRELIEQVGMRNKRVIEIGCGKGTFLRLLAREGANRCVGYDPAYTPGVGEPADGVRFERRLFTPANNEPPAEVVICRHTLEHIRDLPAFGRLLHAATAPGGRLILEVPALERIAREGAFWDLYYEHANTFDAASLSRFVASAGFDETGQRFVYHDQYLLSVAERRAAPATSPPTPPSRADQMRRNVDAARKFWTGRLRRAQQHGQRVALWGSGSKAVGFLMGVADAAPVPIAAVDICARRQGKHMPGFGLPIVPPSALRELRPDLVIAMNAVYVDEISAELRAQAAHTELVALGGATP